VLARHTSHESLSALSIVEGDDRLRGRASLKFDVNELVNLTNELRVVFNRAEKFLFSLKGIVLDRSHKFNRVHTIYIKFDMYMNHIYLWLCERVPSESTVT
jgi:hypothetical protein